ncbi:MAG: low molecular weight protein-tyrosine-phosphatase [Actinomycetes bacterium]
MKVAVICTGNICRSPIGEILLREAIAAVPEMAQRVEVTSAGTANWHVGKEMDPRAAAALQRAGLPTDATLGAFASAELLRELGLVVVMTREHRTDVLARHPEADVLLVRELLGHGSMDVADPYYGQDQDFDDCLAMLRDVTPLVVRELQLRLADHAV